MRQKHPFFSIIIPTYNRPKQLESCLHSLADLEYPRDHFEVIVVDDDSEFSPETVVSNFRESLDLSLLTKPHAGPAAARNFGAKQAKGEFLTFVDDDCVPAPDWLQALVAQLAITRSRAIAIGGRVINTLTNNPYSTASQLLINYLYDYYNDKKISFLTSNNLTISTDHFRAIGGFDMTFPLAAGEDRELCDRWLKYGYRMIYSSKAVVYHAHKLTFSTFFRQHFNYGRGAFHFHQIRSRHNQSRIRIESVSFYLNMLCYPFSKVEGLQVLLLVLLQIVSQVANATGFFWKMLEQTINKIGWKRKI